MNIKVHVKPIEITSSVTLILASIKNCCLYFPHRSMWQVREASNRQKNTGMLPRFPTHSLNTQSDLGNAAIVRRVPKLPLCLPPSPALLFFSASQTGERRHYHACPTPSQLSCRWLHMKNNETSSETRLQRRGGVDVKKCSKGGRNCRIKKEEAFVSSSLWPLSLGRFVDLLS